MITSEEIEKLLNSQDLTFGAESISQSAKSAPSSNDLLKIRRGKGAYHTCFTV